METWDWGEDYEMSGDEEEGFDPPSRHSTTADTSQLDVFPPRTLWSTSARRTRRSATVTPVAPSSPQPSPTYMSASLERTPPLPSTPPPDSPFDRFLSLGNLPTVHKTLSGSTAGLFAGCMERLAEAFLAEPSDDTLVNLLALRKAGLARGLERGLKVRLERYPRVEWPRAGAEWWHDTEDHDSHQGHGGVHYGMTEQHRAVAFEYDRESDT